METKLTLALRQETDTDGRDYFDSYFPEDTDLRQLSYALIGNEMLRQVTLSTAAYLIAREPDDSLMEKFSEYIKELKNDIYNLK